MTMEPTLVIKIFHQHHQCYQQYGQCFQQSANSNGNVTKNVANIALVSITNFTTSKKYETSPKQSLYENAILILTNKKYI